MKSSSVDKVPQLGPRALAATIRHSVVPIEITLLDTEYRPFVDEFERACDAAAPWFALGHAPESIRPIDIDAVEMLGSREDQQLWSVIWSAARTMEFARLGELIDAREQFDYTVELIADWPETLADSSRKIRDQISDAVDHVAEITSGKTDPPVDDDTLMIPAFYLHNPSPPESRTTEAKPRSFDVEVKELIRLIKEGRVAIFCGAGISIASGIPSANELRRAVLRRLPATELETTRLVENDLPFEAFMEVLSKATYFEPLLGVFVGTQPTAAHVLFADLISRGLVQTIATTNFDELIERAVGSSTVAVTKVHGTISDLHSIAVTMEAVAARQRLPQREKAIANVFANGNHTAVLVVGYSCSDTFDITPAIESLGDSLKRVWIVEHEPRSKRAEEIGARPWKNPFRRGRNGTRLFCDTERLFARIAREVSTTRPFIRNKYLTFVNEWWSRVTRRPNKRASLRGDEWLTYVDRWWDHVLTSEQLATGHYILGQLWYLCADFRAAKTHYRASLAAGGSRQHPKVRCNALLQIAGCHRALSEYNRALDRGREAYRLAAWLRDDFLEAQAAGTMGNAWFNMGQINKAVEWYERDVEILRKSGSWPRALGSSLANLGNAYGASGDLQRALDCFNEGVELARNLGDKVGEASRLGGMGQVFGMLNRWEDAEATHLESLNISRAMGDVPGIAIQLARLANVEHERGRLDDAIKMATEAAKLFDEIGDRQGEARALGNLGAFYLKTHQVAKAIEYLRRSAEIAEVIGDQSILEAARRNLALIEAAIDAAE